jgi:hypothetical protein
LINVGDCKPSRQNLCAAATVLITLRQLLISCQLGLALPFCKIVSVVDSASVGGSAGGSIGGRGRLCAGRL